MSETPKEPKKKKKSQEITRGGMAPVSKAKRKTSDLDKPELQEITLTRKQLEITIEQAAMFPEEPLNPAFPIRESYIQGLHAIADLTDDPEEKEEFQAQFSINYIERKAREKKIASFTEPTSRKVSGDQIAEYAKKLGEKWGDEWWLNQHVGFIDRVFRDLDIVLPWERGAVPDVHEMRMCLATAKEWEVAYYDVMPLELYKLEPGDISFWDKLVQEKLPDGKTKFNPFLQAGIICDQYDFESMCQNDGAGTPTIIFRLKFDSL